MKKRYLLILFVLLISITGVSLYSIRNNSYALEEENICKTIIGDQIVEAYINDDSGITNFTETAHLSTTKTESRQYDVTLVLHYDNNDNKEQKLDVTVAEGLNWVDWDKETSSLIDKVEEETYKPIILNEYGNIKNKIIHNTKSGKKTFTFNQENNCITLNFVIEIDVPIYKRDIENAIEIKQYYDNDVENGNAISLNVENNFNEIPIITNKNYGANIKEVNGTTNENENNYVSTGGRIAGVYNDSGVLVIYNKFEVTIETPQGVKYLKAAPGGAGYNYNTVVNGWNCSYTGPKINNYDICIYKGENETNNQIYTFTYENVKNVLIGFNPVWDFYGVVPIKIKDNKNVIDIKLKKIEYKIYGEENSHIEEFNTTEDNILINRYNIINEPNISLSSNDYIYGFNPKYPNDIIKLGSFNIKNTSAVTTNEKIINIKFDTNKIGVTHVSLPAVLNQPITDLKYKMITNEENWCNGNSKPDENGWCLFNKYILSDPNSMSTSYSNTLGYVNFINEMTGIDGYIEEVEYTIGKIPGMANTTFSEGVFAYSGVLLKQNSKDLTNKMANIIYPSFYENKDDCNNNVCSKYTKIKNDIYPINYNSTITIKDKNTQNIEKVANDNIKLYNPDNKIYVQFTPFITDANKTTTIITKDSTKLNLTYNIYSGTSSANKNTSLLKEPVIYIKLPKGITLNKENISMTYHYYNHDKSIIEKYKIKTETYKLNDSDYNFNKIDSNDNNNIYKITINKNDSSFLDIGYPKYNLYEKKYNHIDITFNSDINESFNDGNQKHYYHDILYVTDASLFGLDNVKSTINQYYSVNVENPNIDQTITESYPLVKEKEKATYFRIKQESDINVNLKVKNNNEYIQLYNNEYYESERDKGTELELSISNDSGVDNQQGEVFIPIPKAGENWNGLLKTLNNEEEYNSFEYDLFLKEKITNPDSNKYNIYYGKITPTTYKNLLNENIEWTNELNTSSWTEEDFRKINIIKIKINDIDKDEISNFDFVLWNKDVSNIEKSYDNFFAPYYRNLTDSNGNHYSGWKLTNYMSISIPEKEKGKLLVRYVDENGISIKEEKENEQYIGIEYEENPINIEGYTYETAEGNTKGTYQKEEQLIIFHYKKNPININVHYYIENTTNKIKEDEIISGKYKSEQNIEAPLLIEFNDIEYQLISEQTKKITLLSNSEEIIFYYKIKARKQGIVQIIYELEDKTIIQKEQITGNINDEYEVKEKELENYEFISISDNKKGTYQKEIQTVTLTYKKIEKQEKGIVNIIYIDEKGIVIQKEQITGNINDEYEVKEKSLENYEFISISDNKKGTYQKEQITVIIKYKKINQEKDELNNQEENRIKEYEKEEIEVPITSNYFSIIIVIISLLFISLGIIFILLIKKYKIKRNI